MFSPCRRLRALRALPLIALLATSCASIRGTERSTVSTSNTVSSAHWFRGVPLSLQPVLQGDMVVHTPLANGGVVTFTTWYNGQLTNATGDAAFPDGQGGRISEVDLALDYAQRFGRMHVAAGGITYTYPEIRESTKEAYLSGTLEAFGLAHTLTGFYEIDQVEDAYLLYQASRSFTLDEHWSTALAVLLGYMGDGQAEHYFGTQKSGFSDLLLTGSLTYAFDENSTVFIRAAGVSVPDDELADALDSTGLENSGLWISLGAAFGL